MNWNNPKSIDAILLGIFDFYEIIRRDNKTPKRVPQRNVTSLIDAEVAILIMFTHKVHEFAAQALIYMTALNKCKLSCSITMQASYDCAVQQEITRQTLKLADF